ncbi:DUF4390 domain-containing protein [Aquabacterium humicola]|uniref:DUF4390 domain-containing protein n=1 Tax=Aquabacterium humicola TaxID=3237377 RepID=UPI002543C911|nr:DUF4390 domain-containing protein [Rubrivivax pictus]
MRRTIAPALLPRFLTRLVLWAALIVGLGGMPPARAQGVDLTSLEVTRTEGALTLEYAARLTLSHAIEDALQRGVPMYFTAHVTVLRSRWYWRDERIARIARTWRLSYQPLTATWRVSLGGLAQSFPTLAEALAPMSRVAGWRLVEAEKLEPAERYYVEFSFQLDNSQLPRPMQLDLGQDWKLGIERSARVE